MENEIMQENNAFKALAPVLRDGIVIPQGEVRVTLQSEHVRVAQIDPFHLGGNNSFLREEAVGAFAALLPPGREAEEISLQEFLEYCAAQVENYSSWMEANFADIYADKNLYLGGDRSVMQMLADRFDYCSMLLALIETLDACSIKDITVDQVELFSQHFPSGHIGIKNVLADGALPEETFERKKLPSIQDSLVLDLPTRRQRHADYFQFLRTVPATQFALQGDCETVMDALFLVLYHTMRIRLNVRRCRGCGRFFVTANAREHYCSDVCKQEHERQRVARYRNDEVNTLAERISNMLRNRVQSAPLDERESRQEDFYRYCSAWDKLKKKYRSGAVSEQDCLETLREMQGRYKNQKKRQWR